MSSLTSSKRHMDMVSISISTPIVHLRIYDIYSKLLDRPIAMTIDYSVNENI